MPKVSVIIPVYNTATYLAQCLDSVLAQTLGEIEVLCIENGSTDSSLEILREYEQKDHRLRVALHPEGRLGDARNVGLDKASGDYISFVDSDDFIAEPMLEDMYLRAVNHNADLAICGVTFYSDTSGKCEEKDPSMFPAEECVNLADHRPFLGSMTAWNKLYKRAFVEKHGFRYPENIYYEDQLFVARAYFLANRIAVARQPYYFYRKQRPGQISARSDEHVFDIFRIFAELGKFAESESLPETHLQDLAEIEVNALFYLFAYTDGELRRRFFDRMQQEFRQLRIQAPPHFLSNTLYNNYLIVRNRRYTSAALMLQAKKRSGRLLQIPLIKSAYLAARRSRRPAAPSLLG